MDDNLLESVAFGQHPNLAKVSMNTNKLKEFNASSFPGLVYLDLSENELESINLTGCELIESLWLNYNKLTSIDAGSLPDKMNKFEYFFNPGENGVLKVIYGKISGTSYSWQMIKGDESSRVKGTLYCEKSPKIKTQPKPEIAAKTGVPFSVSVEMESTGNYQYYWCLSAPAEVGSTGLTGYPFNPISDFSDGTYYISGSNTNTLTINVGNLDMFVLLTCVIYDEATGTTTISDFANIKYQ
jgi:Leucine-rich repeat (LRR) protein